MTSLTKEATAAARGQAPRRRPVQELLRPRPDLLGVLPADRPDARPGSSSVRRATPLVRDGQPRRVPGRLELRRDRRALRPPVRGQAGRPAGRRVHATSPATPRWRGAWSPPASWPTCRCSSAATRSRRRPTSSTSCPSTRTSACARCRPRTRSPRVGTALGAAFAGHLGVTTTSGPGLALKSETISLAISLELPLLVIDIQRGGPSTGLPTKTEAADLNLALYGRHAEAPLPVVAAYSPSHCFDAAIEAARIALKYRTPVILLSDGYLANGAEPWRLPDVDDAARHLGAVRHRAEPRATTTATLEFWPYLRDPETLARPWAIPGTPGLMHRVGGIEKEDGSGNISYEPENHERMVHLRAAKVAGIAKDIPPVEVGGDATTPTSSCVGWGSTWARHRRRGRAAGPPGTKVAWVHLVHLNPLPSDLGEIAAPLPRTWSCPR